MNGPSWVLFFNRKLKKKSMHVVNCFIHWSVENLVGMVLKTRPMLPKKGVWNFQYIYDREKLIFFWLTDMWSSRNMLQKVAAKSSIVKNRRV